MNVAGLRAWRVAPVVGLMLAGVLGCGDGSSGGDTLPPPVFAAADPSKTCPAGYVGWDFATGGGFDPTPDLIGVKRLECNFIPQYSEQDRDYVRQLIRDVCNGFQSCSVPFGCEVTYVCGNSDVEQTVAAARGDVISCYLPADADGGVKQTDAPTGKACVPKHCPLDSYRDADMQCQPGPKQSPGNYMFGPPTAIPLQKTSADENAERLVAGTEYLFVSTLHVEKFRQPHLPFAAPDGRLVYWLADEYVRKDGSGDPVQGFRCTAASAHVSPGTAHTYPDHGIPLQVGSLPFGTRYISTRATISPECVREEFAEAAKKDAARRAGVAVADFDQQYRLQRLRLHTSFDLEARTLIPDAVAERVGLPDNTCAPNPPGFFYHADPNDKSRSYIDWIGYYRQREITAYGFPFEDPTYYVRPAYSAPAGSAERHAFFFEHFCRNHKCDISEANDYAIGTPFGTRSSELATRIRMSAKYLRVNKPEITMRAFGNSTASVRVDVGYRLAGGDNKSNPYSFGGPSAADVESLSERGLRADVYIHPDGTQAFDESVATAIGSVALRDGPVTGASVSGSVSISRKKMARFFNEWKDQNNFRLYYCLGGKGLSVINGRALAFELPVVKNDGVSYGAGLDADEPFCMEGDSVVVVTRDYTRTPNDPASATPNFENSRDEGSGDDNTSGSQGNGAEQTCNSKSCQLRQRGDMASSGMFGKSIFDSNSDTVETRHDDGTGTVKMSGTSEALGFQVIDSSDMDAFDWGGASTADRNGLTVTRSIDWSAIEEAIDRANQGTNVEATTGKYSGRDGLGIAYGYKARMNIGPIPGEVNVGVSAGVGLAITFKLSVLPAKDYPCEGSSEKCYQVVSDAATQADARSACAQMGAILFEPRNAGEMSDLRTLIASKGGGATRFWVGGQQGYEYVGGGCASAQSDADRRACAANAKLSYRWLSDDEVFASAQGFGDPTVGDGQFVTTADLRLQSGLPNQEGAIAYDDGSERLVLRAPNELMPAVCEFVPASSVSYLSYSGGIGVGASAGLFMQYCTPSEDLGVCLYGTINFVSVSLGYTMGQQTYTLVDATDSSTVQIGASTMDVPWSLSILSGQIDAIFKLFFFDITVPIVSWPGFAVANGSLYQRTVPVVSRSQ